MTAERFNSALLFVLLSAMPGSVWAGQEAALRPASTTTAKAPEVSRKPDAIRAKKSEGTGGSLDGREFRETRLGVSLLQNIARDQREIWTSPARLRFSDMQWLVPVGGFAAGLLVTDRDTSGHLSRNPQTIRRYNNVANAGVVGLIGVAGGLSLWSFRSHNAHWRETGYLAGEAAINSLLLVETAKYSLRRERLFQGDGSGHFFQGGGTSFPSEHAAAAWSIAGVIAHEYPGPLTKLMAYGLASAVSFSRVRARQHFLSDVFIGGMIGNLVAQQVYSRHHDPELGGGEWRSIGEFFRGEGNSSPANHGSPYVPLDSWIYPALDRLAALGIADTGFAGMRPWTRRECARLLSEAEEKFTDADEVDPEVQKLLSTLARELRPETEATQQDNGGAFRLESLYSRTEHISGMPLTDGYTFAQTQINDFGRPYGEGWSTVNGFSASATRGPWVAYVRGEWQTAPGIPALPLVTREFIQQVDGLPLLPPGTDRTSVHQFNWLDAYVGLTVTNWQITFGRQSLWWGPGNGGPMMFSNNAQPINMFRINRVAPFKLPSILGWLGPIRTEFFLGQLAGYELLLNPTGFVGQSGRPLNPQPIIHGQMFSFKPTANFEFGIFRTTIYGGPGYPFTPHTFLRSLFTTGNEAAGGPTKPGDRRSGLQFSYRLPRMRNWLTFYGDGFTDDQFSPIAYADRSAWHAGLYLSHVPRLSKIDLRVEGVYTDVPGGRGAIAPGTFYSNGTWRSGYTNNGYLIGSWIGRGGQGAQAWTNYWFGPRNRLQFNFRHQKVSQGFVPGGGTLTDAGVRGDYWVRANLSLSAWVQHEQWLFPVIQPEAFRNVTAAVEIRFAPQKVFHRSRASAFDTSSRIGGRP